jgi:ABC-type microcin C transport system permease subunit YejE
VVWERLNILGCDYDIKDVFEELFCLRCCNSLLFAVFGTVVSAYFGFGGIDVTPYFS